MGAPEKLADKIKFLEANLARESDELEKARMRGEVAALKLILEKKLAKKAPEKLAEIKGIISGAQKALEVAESG